MKQTQIMNYIKDHSKILIEIFINFLYLNFILNQMYCLLLINQLIFITLLTHFKDLIKVLYQQKNSIYEYLKVWK
jgi:hypothetical protein